MRSVSEQITHRQPHINKQYATTGSLCDSDKVVNSSATGEKKVLFNTKVNVVLIPSRKDYCEANLSENICFNEYEYSQFKQEALSELRRFMIQNETTDLKSALALLLKDNVDEGKDNEISIPPPECQQKIIDVKVPSGYAEKSFLEYTDVFIG